MEKAQNPEDLFEEYLRDRYEFDDSRFIQKNKNYDLKTQDYDIEVSVVALKDYLNLYKKHRLLLCFVNDVDLAGSSLVLDSYFFNLNNSRIKDGFVKLEVSGCKAIGFYDNFQLIKALADPLQIYSLINQEELKEDFNSAGLSVPIDFDKLKLDSFQHESVFFRCIFQFINSMLSGNEAMVGTSYLTTLFQLAGFELFFAAEFFNELPSCHYCINSGVKLERPVLFAEKKHKTDFTKPKGSGEAILNHLTNLKNLTDTEAIKKQVEKKVVPNVKEFLDKISKNSNTPAVAVPYDPSIQDVLVELLSKPRIIANFMFEGYISQEGELIVSSNILKKNLEGHQGINKKISQVTFLCQLHKVKELIKETVRKSEVKEIYFKLREEHVADFLKNNPQFKNIPKPWQWAASKSPTLQTWVARVRKL